MKEYSLRELNEGLYQGKWTSSSLVTMYLERINRYDQDGPKLNSISEINPDAMYLAKALDMERKESGPRSLLHGIPIAVKDNINTHDKMHTTAGSLALQDLFAPYDATVIKKLREAGAIILAKTNLSEFAYFMSEDMPSGFSSRRGQVKNPYDERLDPLGSSTGSAVSVAANLIPVSLGTETNGSLMAPALMNCVVSIKPTLGLVSRYGIIPISGNQDTAGPMGRSVADCADLLDIIAGRDENDPATWLIPKKNFHYGEAVNLPVKGMKVGIMYLSDATYQDEEMKILSEAKEILSGAGMEVVDLSVPEDKIDDFLTLKHEFRHDLDYYLSTVRGHTKMTCLEDIIRFNQEDPKVRMPYGQSILVAAAKLSGTLTEPEYFRAREKVLDEAFELTRLMEKYALDAIVSPRRTSHAPVAGNPCISVPSKTPTDLKPRSLIFIGKHWDEERLIAISHTYEKRTHYRIPPVFDREIKKERQEKNDENH